MMSHISVTVSAWKYPAILSLPIPLFLIQCVKLSDIVLSHKKNPKISLNQLKLDYSYFLFFFLLTFNFSVVIGRQKKRRGKQKEKHCSSICDPQNRKILEDFSYIRRCIATHISSHSPLGECDGLRKFRRGGRACPLTARWVASTWSPTERVILWAKRSCWTCGLHMSGKKLLTCDDRFCHHIVSICSKGNF